MGPTFVRDELENLTVSDYESESRLEVTDFHTASGEIDDMQTDSDTEDVSRPLVRMRPSRQETIPCAGRPLREVAAYTELNKAMTNHAWSPFSLENQFNLATWDVRSSVCYGASGARKSPGPRPNSPPRAVLRGGAGRVSLGFPAPAPAPARSPDGSLLKQVGRNKAPSRE